MPRTSGRSHATVRWRAQVGAGALALTLVVGACGGGDKEPSQVVAEFQAIGPAALPDQLLDLQVGVESFSPTLPGGEKTYIDAIGIFGLRRDDLLQATVQMSRFADPSQLVDPIFRRTIAAQVGGTNPTLARVGDKEIFLVPSGGQTLGIWFGDDAMYVLTIRAEYEQPRRLVRALLVETAGDLPSAVPTTTTTSTSTSTPDGDAPSTPDGDAPSTPAEVSP